MTIQELKKEYSDSVGFLDLDLILSYSLRKSREQLLAHPEQRLTSAQLAKIKKLIDQRIKGMPLAYLTHEKEFYGLSFYVNEHTLIPRPETELMVEEALSITTKEQKNKRTKHIIVDVGTGSGCIAITLAKKLNTTSHPCHPREGEDPELKLSTNLDSRICGNDRIKVFAIDISKEALKVARKNAKLHGVNDKIKFFHGDLLKPLIDKKLLIVNCKLLIVCNLPYLTPEQVKHSPTIKHEPRSALVAGPDGLKYYRQLFKQIKKFNLLNCELLCEIDHTQTANMKKLIGQELPDWKFKIKKDLGGYDRLVIIKSL